MPDVELPMCFESAHSVPKLSKFLHFATSLLIAYDGPGGPSRATRLSKHKQLSLMNKVILCRWYTNERPQLNVVGV